MKEKISCSLDGKLVEIMDHVISQRPIVKTRSAFIEMSLILTYGTLFSDVDFDDNSAGFNNELFDKLYEMRCAMNAKTEHEN